MSGRSQIGRSALWQSLGIIIPLLVVHAIFRHIIHADGPAWLFASAVVIGMWWLIWTLISVFEDE
jgi:hypothetical protein